MPPKPKYIEHISKRDKVMKQVLSRHKPKKLSRRENVFLSLVRSIMSQQLSTKVAQVIYGQFLELYGSKEPTAQQILDTPSEKLRAVGLSNAKVSYVKNVAAFHIESGLDADKLHGMDNNEVIEYITQIKGVGQWTAEMILMFTLGRPDVFSSGDLGLQTAIVKLYGVRQKDKKKLKVKLEKIAEQWSPYRTYACMHLWNWKDNAPEIS